MSAKPEVWLHIPTNTLAVVIGDHGEFHLNGRAEESYWGYFRTVDACGWERIGWL